MPVCHASSTRLPLIPRPSLSVGTSKSPLAASQRPGRTSVGCEDHERGASIKSVEQAAAHSTGHCDRASSVAQQAKAQLENRTQSQVASTGVRDGKAKARPVNAPSPGWSLDPITVDVVFADNVLPGYTLLEGRDSPPVQVHRIQPAKALQQKPASAGRDAITSVSFPVSETYTVLGDRIFATGSIPELGNWNPMKGVELSTRVAVTTFRCDKPPWKRLDPT